MQLPRFSSKYSCRYYFRFIVCARCTSSERLAYSLSKNGNDKNNFGTAFKKKKQVNPGIHDDGSVIQIHIHIGSVTLWALT